MTWRRVQPGLYSSEDGLTIINDHRDEVLPPEPPGWRVERVALLLIAAGPRITGWQTEEVSGPYRTLAEAKREGDSLAGTFVLGLAS